MKSFKDHKVVDLTEMQDAEIDAYAKRLTEEQLNEVIGLTFIQI